MPLRPTTLAVLLSACLATSLTTSAWAQAPAATGTGGGPASTATAPNTSAVGRTKPPGGAGAAEEGEATRRTERQRQDDGIQKGICIGCSPK